MTRRANRSTKLEENFETATIIHGNFQMLWESGRGLSFKEDEMAEDGRSELSAGCQPLELPFQHDEKADETVSGHDFGSGEMNSDETRPDNEEGKQVEASQDAKPAREDVGDDEGSTSSSTCTDDIETIFEVSTITSPILSSPVVERRDVKSESFATSFIRLVDNLREQVSDECMADARGTVRSILHLLRSKEDLNFDNLLLFLSDKIDSSEISLVELADEVHEAFGQLKTILTAPYHRELWEEFAGGGEETIESEHVGHRSSRFDELPSDRPASEAGETRGTSASSYAAFSDVNYKQDIGKALLFTSRDGRRHNRKFESSDQTVVKWQRYKEIARKAFDVASDANFESERGRVRASASFNMVCGSSPLLAQSDCVFQSE